MKVATDPYEHAPLAGVRVLDLTRLLPGPMATLALADLGARVDKLEDPGPGDYLRHMPPQTGEVNGAFLAINRDKRAGVLDLKNPSGASALLRMVASYDVVVESFRPGVLARLGLAHERLLEANPRLVVCAITGYGQTGPMAQRAGHDINYLARAGLLGVTGPPGAPPALSGGQIADVAGGALWAVSGIVAALFARERSGKGRVLDISMTEGSMAIAGFALACHFTGGKVPERGHSYLDGGLAVYRTYVTSDGGFVALGALEPKFWSAFCAPLGIEPSMSALLPGPHQTEWHQRLEGVFASRTRAAWVDFAKEHDCCLEPVLAPDELLEDAQHGAREVFFELAGQRCFRTPLGAPHTEHVTARAAGADTAAILTDCGFDENDINALRAHGVLGTSD